MAPAQALSYFPTPQLPVPQTAAEFRRIASAFRDPTQFPDEEIEFWLMAANLMMTCRWGDLRGAGAVLFAEHNLALGAWINQQTAPGGIPGVGMRGMVSSESAGGVSISYETAAALEPGAGHWNLTLYGQRFIRLARIIGTGPIQLNVPPFAGICPGCGCYGMMDPLQQSLGGRFNGNGPGFHDMKNVPVGKFIPPRPPAMPTLPPRGFTVTPLERPDLAPNYTFSEGDVLSNPETGEKVQLRGGAWVFIE